MNDGVRVTLEVPDEAEGSRLDRFLADRVEGQTRSALRRLILEGRVTINGDAPPKCSRKMPPISYIISPRFPCLIWMTASRQPRPCVALMKPLT